MSYNEFPPDERFIHDIFRVDHVYGSLENTVYPNSETDPAYRYFELLSKKEGVQLRLKNDEMGLDLSLIIKWSKRAPLNLGIKDGDFISTLAYMGSILPGMNLENLRPQLWDKRFSVRVEELNSYGIKTWLALFFKKRSLRTFRERPRFGNPKNRWVDILEIPIVTNPSSARDEYFNPGLPTEPPSNTIQLQFHLDSLGNLVVSVTDLTMITEVTTVYQLQGQPSTLILRLGYN